MQYVLPKTFGLWFVAHLFSGFSLARLNEKHGTDTRLVSTGKGATTTRVCDSLKSLKGAMQTTPSSFQIRSCSLGSEHDYILKTGKRAVYLISTKQGFKLNDPCPRTELNKNHAAWIQGLI